VLERPCAHLYETGAPTRARARSRERAQTPAYSGERVQCGPLDADALRCRNAAGVARAVSPRSSPYSARCGASPRLDRAAPVAPDSTTAVSRHAEWIVCFCMNTSLVPRAART
jgi:hypothetical protein